MGKIWQAALIRGSYHYLLYDYLYHHGTLSLKAWHLILYWATSAKFHLTNIAAET